MLKKRKDAGYQKNVGGGDNGKEIPPPRRKVSFFFGWNAYELRLKVGER